MIISNLQNSGRVESLHPLFKKLFDYVKTHDLLQTPCGRIELEGDNLFINNVNPTCVQAEGDCALYTDKPTTYVNLLPGQFAIVFPEDPHAPVIGEGKIRKLIGKVKL